MVATFVHDLVIGVNAGFELPMTWVDKNKEPRPLSSYHARMQIRENQGETGEPLVEVDSFDAGGITLAEAGDIDVFIPASKTAALAPYVGQTLEYDLLLIPIADPERSVRFVAGDVRPEPGTTR